MDSCANQEGSTDCAGEGRSWCHAIDPECDEVERLENGLSVGWFYCEAKTGAPLTLSTINNDPQTFRDLSHQGVSHSLSLGELTHTYLLSIKTLINLII